MIEQNTEVEIGPLVTVSVMVPKAIMEEVAQKLHDAFALVPDRTFEHVSIRGYSHELALVTGSVRTSREQIIAACEYCEELQGTFGGDQIERPFFRVTISGYGEPPVKGLSIDELSKEERESITASRTKIVPTKPHVGFGIRLHKSSPSHA